MVLRILLPNDVEHTLLGLDALLTGMLTEGVKDMLLVRVVSESDLEARHGELNVGS
jgi:hypothetical protein